MAGLQEKLKVPREFGKKGSKVKITWTADDQNSFDEIKKVVFQIGVATRKPGQTFCPKS